MPPLPAPTGLRPPWWELRWAVLLACLYLPTLGTRFDFADDGCLVYPAGVGSPAEHGRHVWETTLADFHTRGPFRPVFWAHLVTAAELLHADARAWRAVHLAWAVVAAATLLWLLRELGTHPTAAVLAAALAMWNPYRGETWINLSVTEGVAMPYALAALACAVRAARSDRPAGWDLAGGLCMLLALGCKNTLAAAVPAQLLLRVAPDGLSLREGLRRHYRRAMLLSLTLLLPVGHYVAYKLTWRPGQYAVAGLGWAQLADMLRTVRGALSYEFMTPGLVLAGLAVWWARESDLPPRRYRAACLAGVLLLACGIAIYLPINGVAGRYSMPAVWGADLLIAVLLSRLAAAPASYWKRAAFAAFVGGLAVVAVANLGKQDKYRARSALLWQAVEWAEAELPPGACLAWNNSPQLDVSEAIHFYHHLYGRGRTDLSLRVLDDPTGRVPGDRLGAGAAAPHYALSAQAAPPADGRWQLLREFRIVYWCRLRGFRCYLYQGGAGGP